MNRVKKALAVIMIAVMAVSSTAFAATSSVTKTDISSSVSATTTTATSVYNGTNNSTLTITVNGQTLTEGVDFTVVGVKPTTAGTYTIAIEGIGAYSGLTEITYTITKATTTSEAKASIIPTNKTAKALNKATTKGFKSSQLAKKAKKIKIKYKNATVKTVKAKGKKSKKYIKVTKKGNVKLKKGTPKGTYKVKVKIKGTKNHKAVTITYKIKVK